MTTDGSHEVSYRDVFADDATSSFLLAPIGLVIVPLVKSVHGFNGESPYKWAREAAEDKFYIESGVFRAYETLSLLVYWSANALGKGYRRTKDKLFPRRVIQQSSPRRVEI